MRTLALKILKATNMDVKIRHHWVEDKKICLNTFTHKGYWYHGKNREAGVMLNFARLISPGQTVLEVGGHIGYISLYFAKLVGPQGQVHVFEPGRTNLTYIKGNIAQSSTIRLHELAVSDTEGEVKFFTENLSGQNNSLISDFAGLEANAKVAGIKPSVNVETVQAVTLDGFVSRNNLSPDFIKIDVEGAEELVVRGMQKVLAEHSPIIMIETNQTHDAVFALFHANGYVVLDEELKPYGPNSPTPTNSFCLPLEKAKQLQLA
ncbi:FkbM family methyltransferase [Blastomonas fulva]|nr:FkbM family methyltransferase [Blastomonas fulva]